MDPEAPNTRATEHRSILETAHESFISMDSEGRIVEWNGQAETDFGWRRHEVIGRHLAEAVRLSSSTGLVLRGDHELDLELLLHDADVAMYAAKTAGGSRHVVFRPEMRGPWPGELPVSSEITPEAISRGALSPRPR